MKLYYGGYGHHPSGKQYVYWGDDNYRTGQNVNVPVTNWKTGKTYNTMFTIQRTSGSTMGEQEAERLENSDINIKTINGTNVMTLPGAYDFSSKSAWKEYSDEQYAQEIQRRLGAFTPPKNTAEAYERLATSGFINHKIPINAQYRQGISGKYNPAQALSGQSVQQVKTSDIEINKEYKPFENTDFTKKMF